MEIDFSPDRSLYPFESRWFESSSGRIHYIDEGAGPTLLLCHGNPTWSFLYRHIVRALRDRFRCVAMDYLGFGLSDRPDRYGYTIEEHAGAVGELVDDLDLEGVVVMGQDWGGPIGMAVCVDRADRVRGLVLGNTWFWPAESLSMRAFSRVMSSGPLQRQILERNLFVERLMPRAMARKLTPQEMDHYRKTQPTPEARRGVAEMPRQILAARPLLERLARQVPERLARKPALLVWGMKDLGFRPKSFLARMRLTFPDHTLVEPPAPSTTSKRTHPTTSPPPSPDGSAGRAPTPRGGAPRHRSSQSRAEATVAQHRRDVGQDLGQVLADYLAAGGGLVFNTGAPFDWFSQHVVRGLVTELGADLHVLRNVPLILSGGNEIYVFEEGAYRLRHRSQGRTKADCLVELVRLSRQTDVVPWNDLDPVPLICLGDSYSVAGIDESMAGAVGIVINVGEPIFTMPGRLLTLVGGYRRAIDVFAIAAAALQDSGRAKPRHRMPAPATRCCGPSRTSTPPGRRVRVRVGDSGYVHAGVAHPDGRWDPVYNVPPHPATRRQLRGAAPAPGQRVHVLLDGAAAKPRPSRALGTRATGGTRVHDCGRRTWRHTYWSRPRWERRLTSARRSARSTAWSPPR